jgi:hypothetical protein
MKNNLECYKCIKQYCPKRCFNTHEGSLIALNKLFNEINDKKQWTKLTFMSSDLELSEIDKKILTLNGVSMSNIEKKICNAARMKTVQTTIIKKPIWCPNQQTLCTKCNYRNRCRFVKELTYD